MILLIDNYDSFVFNLARYVGKLNYHRQVVRNDQISIDDIKKINPSHVILSPGPCAPSQAGICCEVVKQFAGKIPILGVCLGHQVIGEVYGAKITRAIEPMHGKKSSIAHTDHPLFSGLPNPLTVARYHSLIVEQKGLSEAMEVIAYSKKNEVMAIAHRDLPVYGVQFHPESVLTEQGIKLIENFLKY